MNSSSSSRNSSLVWVTLVPTLAFTLLLFLPMDASGQLLAALGIIMLMLVAVSLSELQSQLRQLFRVLVLVMGIALTLRYIFWRGLYTLTADDYLSLLCVWLLFAAELYAAFTHIIGCIVNASPLTRPLLDIEETDPSKLPTVDVLVPSYNEDEEILETTLRAALNLQYPSERFTVHLLDDGGTDAKVNQTNQKAAAAALSRRQSLQALCARLGVTYRTRPKNEFAKAGNVNYALGHTHGDLVVILDADHVPTADFLRRTVPWMIKDEKVFLVQTPHFMANPDPIERNYFSAFERMPSENDMFYGTIQKGLDYWSSSFFCGSAAVIRRKHLDEVDGLSGQSITEDAETALDLHALGYRSVYVDRPMVSGLAPETFDGFIVQRMRWAQGMTQILLLKKPYANKGLHWYQRLGYMSSILFWLFPFARIVFLLMPLAYLVFGLQVYHASLLEIVAFTLPHLIGTYMVSTMLFGRTRWPLVSELYELLQCVFTFRALVKVFRNPHKPSFVVTPKGDTLEKDFISPLSGPFYILFVVLMLGMVVGGVRWWTDPLTRDLTSVVMLWNLFNLVLMLGIFSVLIERKQVRSQPRLPAQDNVTMLDKTRRLFQAKLRDISANGARIIVAEPIEWQVGDQVTLQGWSEATQRLVLLPARVTAAQSGPKDAIVRLKFNPQTEQQHREVVGFTLGDSRRWVSFQRRRTRPMPFWQGMSHILKVSVVPPLTHALNFLILLTKKFNKEKTNV
ncbi:UDP-forming cellulose synthase catalytic subunit [Aliiglaciecola sp. CAU 1673]|uniref:UDP-forming cellulose synthase catalytic subunit n=1 Tax=Aliiglaciecola sp. CAU 1673 TaxID=3032595 RepID=UPI0023D9AF3B|nr:UDP-forming cellulose synthase catalytic subunit [Aliiglaciecola sp. CAU 1673]MDF2179652.1 UDP-forming cellulose synthase catalytic subunit [Aliiglaciecola sp. CAU 1673]